MTTQLTEIMAIHTGQSFERIMHDTERDYFMSSQEAKEYGIVGVPTIVFLDSKGHEVSAERLVGFEAKQAFLERARRVR